MTRLEQTANHFWNAANFSRRAPERNQDDAIRVLHYLTHNAPQKIQRRAAEALKGIQNEPSRKR